MGPDDRVELGRGGTSRRTFIRNSVVASGALVGGSGAAGGVRRRRAGGSSTRRGGRTGKPGGALRLGVSGGSSQDTLDPHKWSSQIDGARVSQMYEWLAPRKRDYGLCQSSGPSSPPTLRAKMTVKLRPGVTFHNGKPLTSEDVVFTYHRILDPKGYVGAAVFGPVIDHRRGGRSVDSSFQAEVPVQCVRGLRLQLRMGIIPVGWDRSIQIGTGPFKFQSLTPGQQSVFNRNENYWDSPRTVRGLGDDHRPHR